MLGIGPVGLAFFTWDIGMKHGDIQLLGVASYAAPLLSTLALIVSGRAHGIAAVAVVALPDRPAGRRWPPAPACQRI